MATKIRNQNKQPDPNRVELATDSACSSTRDRSTSIELAHTLACWEVVDLAPWQPEIAAAASDLAAAAGVAWKVAPDERVVALCRIVTKLAQFAPTATSPLAAHLIDALTLARS
jgi:hypothetical protein